MPKHTISRQWQAGNGDLDRRSHRLAGRRVPIGPVQPNRPRLVNEAGERTPAASGERSALLHAERTPRC